MRYPDSEFRIVCGHSRELPCQGLFDLVTAIYRPAVDGNAYSTGLFHTLVRQIIDRRTPDPTASRVHCSRNIAVKLHEVETGQPR